MRPSEHPSGFDPSGSSQSSSAAKLTAGEAQLSSRDGVRPNVSSLAIDGGLLSFGGGPQPASPLAASESPEAIADAEVMLKVKTGDESAFAYLVQKYRRPMISFMYRMCHNPAAAEELAQEVFLR